MSASSKTDWLIAPALADTTSTERAVRLLSDPAWLATQKGDGVRLLIICHEGKVYGVNRRGSLVTVPAKIAEPFRHMEGSWAFDGELISNRYYIFDMPRALDLVGLDTPHSTRRKALEDLFPKVGFPDCVQLLPSYSDTEDKLVLAQRLLESNREGVVLKRASSSYVPGKRTSDWLKLKFTKDIDCIVVDKGVDGKSNLALGLMREDGVVKEIAHASALTGDGMSVGVGDVVTVQFLYVSDDDHLVQPTKPRLRADKKPSECGWDQLEHYKVNKEILL